VRSTIFVLKIWYTSIQIFGENRVQTWAQQILKRPAAPCAVTSRCDAAPAPSTSASACHPTLLRLRSHAALGHAPSPGAAPQGRGIPDRAHTRDRAVPVGARHGPPVRRQHTAVRAPVEMAVLRQHLGHHGDVTREPSYKSPSTVRLSTPHRARRPPLPPPPCARVVSRPHRWSASPTHSLGPVAPQQASHFHPCALPSPEPEPPRPPPPAIAEHPRRRRLRPNHGHHSTLGELVVDPDPFPGQERRRSRRIPASPPPRGSRDPIAWPKIFPGASGQTYIFNSILHLLKLIKCVEIRRKFRKMQP
jgi:hypothetical protein